MIGRPGSRRAGGRPFAAAPRRDPPVPGRATGAKRRRQSRAPGPAGPGRSGACIAFRVLIIVGAP